MALRINGTTIKTPTSFKISFYKLSDAKRLANGEMVMDIIATKRRFDIEYAAISGPELKTITDILEASTFVTFSYPEGGVEQTATVYPGDIVKTLWTIRDGIEWYQDVSFPLIEK